MRSTDNDLPKSKVFLQFIPKADTFKGQKNQAIKANYRNSKQSTALSKPI